MNGAGSSRPQESNMAKHRIYSTERLNGINASPVATGDWRGAYDLANVDLNNIGRWEQRLGHVRDTTPVRRSGNRIAKFYYKGVGGRPSYSRIFKYNDRDTYVTAGERIIISSYEDGARWISGSSFREYDLLLPKPPIVNHVILPTGGGPSTADNPRRENLMTTPFDVPGSVGHRGNYTFGMSYRFFDDQFGLYTPVSDPLLFNVLIDVRDPEKNIRSHIMRPSLPLGEAPAWSQGVEIFITEIAIERADLYDSERFEAEFIRHDNNPNRISVPLKYLADELGITFRSVTKQTVVAGGSAEVQVDLELEFPEIEETELVEGEHTVTLDYGEYPDELVPFIEGDPPNLEHIVLYAGRIWGYDRDTNAIVFSLIDGRGISVYDIFPIEDASIAHSISLEGMWESSVTGMSLIQNDAGIYVFFRDAIRTITGEGNFTGLYGITLPNTDIDASGGITGFGTLSPDSIIEFRNFTIFLGSDKKIYQLSGVDTLNLQEISLPIQPFLDAIPVDELIDVVACQYQDKYHLILADDVFVFDAQRKYWVRHTWNIQDAFWATGGVENESILYGLFEDGLVVRLYESELDNHQNITAYYQSNPLPTNSVISTLSEIYIYHSTQDPPSIFVTVDVDGVAGTEIEATPDISNRYRVGYFARGNIFTLKIRMPHGILDVSEIYLEIN